VILGAGKVPPHRQGSRVMRTLGYALALIAVGCSQQSRKLRNSNYELVDGHCTAACANGAIPGEDGASNPRREKVDMEVRTKHIVGRSVIPSFGTKKWASIDFPKAAETNRPPQPPARHAFQVSPLQKGTNGFVLLNLLLSANQLKVEHSRLSPFSTISSRPYPRRCDMLIPFQPTLSVVLNHNVPFDEQLRDHNAILNDYYNASEAANHSKRSVDFDRWFLPGWFNGYKVQDYHHPEGRQLFVWEALHPVIGFEIARVYSNALAVTRLKYRSSTSYLGRIKCLADFVCAPVTHVPDAGGLAMTAAISTAIGGCAANVAMDLAKIGRRAAVVGLVGADLPGRFVRGELAAGGVDTTYVVETPAAQTSATLVINVRGEDRRFIHTFGANAEFDGRVVTPALVRQSCILYVGGFFLMPRMTAERVVELFRCARESHVPTVLDVVIPDPRTCREQLEKVLPWTDVFLPNVDEARLLTDLADPLEQARVFRDAGAETVVITCGSDGAVLSGKSGTLRSGRFPVEFVDGTGSGDAFAAGYIAGLLDGCTPEKCLEMGSALGASCVRRAGATPGVFTRSELDEFLATHRLPIF